MKYIDADLLRKEIERRIRSIESCPFIEAEVGAYDKRDGKLMAFRNLLDFLDTLPVQPVEGLEEKDFVEEVRQYYSNNCTWDALKQPMLSIITRCARHFAEWGAEHLKK